MTLHMHNVYAHSVAWANLLE